MNTQSNIDRLNRQIADLPKQLEAAGLAIHHPNLPAEIESVLGQLKLRAAASKGTLSVQQVDVALAAKNITGVDAMAMKLKLLRTRVMTP